ncbi:MAG: tetratricopeptide repeat protein [Gemmatimonadales bacterium]
MTPSAKASALVFATAVALYVPTARYGFVQDDRGIVELNPAAHSVGAALRAFDQAWWPPPSRAGLYRPLAVVSLAVDWTISGGRPGRLHLMNALWHGVAAVLVVLVFARWLPLAGAALAGFVFAVHPVHVEAVATLVSRTELLATTGMLAGVLAARRGWWAASVACAAAAMLGKEHGVATGVLILLDDWLQPAGSRRYPSVFYAVLAAITAAYLAVWFHVGREATLDVAPPFIGAGTGQRLAVALPATWRAALLLVWPLDLSADYNPQVIPVRSGMSLGAVAGALVVLTVPLLGWWSRRRAPGVAFAVAAAVLTYMPTSNLLFPSGVVLTERGLYLAVALVAALAGYGYARAAAARRRGPASVVALAVCALLALRSLQRLPSWRDNKTFLLTLLTEHPESYRAHKWAATVLAGMGDTTGARREYARADSIFSGDPYLDASRAYFLVWSGDTTGVAALVERARRFLPQHPFALRARFLLLARRGDRAGARALADSVGQWSDLDTDWYRQEIQRVK